PPRWEAPNRFHASRFGVAFGDVLLGQFAPGATSRTERTRRRLYFRCANGQLSSRDRVTGFGLAGPLHFGRLRRWFGRSRKGLRTRFQGRQMRFCFRFGLCPRLWVRAARSDRRWGRGRLVCQWFTGASLFANWEPDSDIRRHAKFRGAPAICRSLHTRWFTFRNRYGPDRAPDCDRSGW